MPPHSFTIFEIKKHYQHEPKINGVYLPKTKDGTCLINLDEYKSIGSHGWLCMRMV